MRDMSPTACCFGVPVFPKRCIKAGTERGTASWNCGAGSDLLYPSISWLIFL